MLSTVERLKKALGLPLDDISEDDMLEFYLQSASDSIETYCKRKFGLGSFQEILDGLRRRYITLSNYPIQQVDSVTSKGAPISDYEIDNEKGMLFRESWPCGDRAITVQYSAGYVLPMDATSNKPSDLPKSLEMACIMLAKTHFEGNMGLKSERLGDHTIEYFESSVAVNKLPPTVIALISPYRGRFL